LVVGLDRHQRHGFGVEGERTVVNVTDEFVASRDRPVEAIDNEIRTEEIGATGPYLALRDDLDHIVVRLTIG
jgi:hypothetical protein